MDRGPGLAHLKNIVYVGNTFSVCLNLDER